MFHISRSLAMDVTDSAAQGPKPETETIADVWARSIVSSNSIYSTSLAILFNEIFYLHIKFCLKYFFIGQSLFSMSMGEVFLGWGGGLILIVNQTKYSIAKM